MSPKRIISLVFLIIIAAVAYYGISPLFRNIKINEVTPEGSSGIAENLGAFGDAIETREKSGQPSDLPGTPVIGTTLHPASGTARVIEGTDGKKYLRYENFKTINGPDLYVYLSKDLDAKEFVNLGRIRGTEGNINYEIPADVNPAEYPYALTWCKQFSVLFNYVKLY